MQHFFSRFSKYFCCIIDTKCYNISKEVIALAVKEGKTRVMIQLDNDRKELLQSIAKEEGRSLSNMINYIITKYLNEQKNKE